MSSALVAIVDDDPRIQELLRSELTDLDHPHCSYSSADALLGDVNNSQPELIFLDVLMPGMGGMECLQQLRQQDFGGVVVMFSALNDAELQEQAKAAGASGWVLKTALFDNVEAVLNRYLPQT